MQSVKWFGNEFVAKLESEMNARLKRASIFLANEMKKSISDKSPPVSAPGTPPHLVTGELRRSITWDLDTSKQIARVGSNKQYAKYLELGTVQMDKREFIERALRVNRGVIKRILIGKKIS